MPRSRHRALVVAVVATAALVGCSSEQEAVTPTTTAPLAGTVPDAGAAARGATTTVSVPENWCVSHMPGEILTAEEAVVRFQDGAICPGYVTVRPGTPITFQNLDDIAHTVVIATGLAPDVGVLEATQIQPGQSWAKTFDSPQTVNYFVDGFEGFRGTLEVRATD